MLLNSIKESISGDLTEFNYLDDISDALSEIWLPAKEANPLIIETDTEIPSKEDLEELKEFQEKLELLEQYLIDIENKSENLSKSKKRFFDRYNRTKSHPKKSTVLKSVFYNTNPTPWVIAFTSTFQKSISNIDKKLQGRVLKAVSDLSNAPITLIGDTIKPLIGELKGLWRYRIGDYRLIYEPNEESKKVVLLEFSPRGSIYE